MSDHSKTTVFMSLALILSALTFPYSAFSQPTIDYQARGVIAYWPFEGDASDASGNSMDGTASAVAYGAGRLGLCAEFNGATSQIVVPDYLQTNALSYSCWIHMSALPGYPNPIYFRRAHWQDQMMGITIPGHLQFGTLLNDPGPHNEVFSPSPVALGQWVHVAGTVDASFTRAYVNGALVAEVASVGDILWTQPVIASMIGKHPTTGEVFNGKIDDLVIFNRVITPAEVLELASDSDVNGVADYWQPWYDNYSFGPDVIAYWPLDGDARDASGNSMDGTASNVTFVTAPFGWCGEFNGTSSQILVPNYAPVTALTFSAWIYIYSLPGYPGVVFMRRANWQDHQMNTTVSGHLQFSTLRDTPGAENHANSPSALPLNQWVHIAGTVDPSFTRAYVNGQLVAENASNGSILWNEPVVATMIGKHPTLSEVFDGRIDELVVFGRALQPAEIALLANDVNANGVADYWDALTYGDVNCDGVADITDVLHIAQKDTGLRAVLDCPQNGDVNCDGMVDLIDALFIAQFDSGLRLSLPDCP